MHECMRKLPSLPRVGLGSAATPTAITLISDPPTPPKASPMGAAHDNSFASFFSPLVEPLGLTCLRRKKEEESDAGLRLSRTSLEAAQHEAFDPVANRAKRDFTPPASPSSPTSAPKPNPADDEEAEEFNAFNFWGPSLTPPKGAMEAT